MGIDNLKGSSHFFKFHKDIRIIEPIMLWFFFISLMFASIKNYTTLFHTGIELFTSGIAIGIFIMALNTYHISKDKFLMFIGIGSLFVGITDVFHAFTYPDINIIVQGSRSLALKFWIVSRYFASFTFFISCLFFIRPAKKFNINLVFIIYLIIFVLSSLSILYFRNFPECVYVENPYINFRVISQCIIISLLIITAIFYYRKRAVINNSLFLYMGLSLICIIIYEIIFIWLPSAYEISNTIGHFMKAISFYFMYKGIIETGLRRPYSFLNDNLQEANRTIDSKISEVNDINKKLADLISYSKEMEKSLIDNEMCLELLMDNSPIAIFAHSDGKFIFANTKAMELLGVDNHKGIIGRKILDFFPEYSKELIAGIIDALYKNDEKIKLIDCHLLRANGEIIDISTIATHFIHKGKPAILGFTWDITSYKQLEILKKDVNEKKKLLDESLEFNRTLVEFFSNISHEFKTPLNVILGAIQVINISKENGDRLEFHEKTDKYFNVIMQNCFRLLRLVNNLIDLSKFDSGDLKLNLRNYNIVSVVEDITLSVADYVEHKGIEVIFDTDTEEKIMAFDPDKIERIMLNLLSNAIKFTNEGDKILVNIVDKGDRISISVKDTGVGIPEDKLNIIFDRFGQVDKTLSRNKEGSGIGLSLVKSIVNMHKGKIDVKSKFGEGSEFIIELPTYTVESKDEVVESKLYESKVERINIEFSDIYN